MEALAWIGEFKWDQLRTGLITIKSELSLVKDYTKTVTIEGTRLSKVMGELGKSFIAAGAIAGGIFAGILQASPVLLPALTRIKFAIERIFKTIAPYFEPMLKFIGDVLSGFADWLARNPLVAESLAKILMVFMGVGAAGGLIYAAKTFFDALMSIVNIGKIAVDIAIKMTDLAISAVEGLLSNLKWIFNNPNLAIKIGVTLAIMGVTWELLKRFLDFYEGKLEPGISKAIPGYEGLFGETARNQRANEINTFIQNPSLETFKPIGNMASGLMSASNPVTVTFNIAGSVIAENDLIDKIKNSILRTLGLSRGT